MGISFVFGGAPMLMLMMILLLYILVAIYATEHNHGEVIAWH